MACFSLYAFVVHCYIVATRRFLLQASKRTNAHLQSHIQNAWMQYVPKYNAQLILYTICNVVYTLLHHYLYSLHPTYTTYTCFITYLYYGSLHGVPIYYMHLYAYILPASPLGSL